MPNASISVGASGNDVARLHSFLVQQGFQLPAAEVNRKFFGPATRQAVQAFQQQNGLPVSAEVDAGTTSLINAAIARAGTQRPLPGTSTPSVAGDPLPSAVAGMNQSDVSGRLFMDYGLAANGVTVRLYSIGYRGAATKLAEAKTDANGAYSLPYTPPAAGANVEVRVVDAQGKETTVSSTVYNAPTQKVMNLVVPASVQPLTAEFNRLSVDVERVIGGNGIQNLATAQESDSQQDLTLLNKTTGWDARLLSLAATAAQQATTAGLGPDLLYALFRAGLPTDPKQLALTPAATITMALSKANQAGIISYTDQQISAATTAFQGFASKTQMTLTSPGGVSNFGDLFKAAAIADPVQHSGFVNLVFSQPVAGADFWDQAGKLGIPATTLNALKLQGKCFYLTRNNLPLTQKILQDIGPTGDISQLAEKDYHDSTTWKTALNGLAGSGGAAALNALIPPAYTGGASNPLEAYAADLALKVRVSFPTQTVGRLVERGTLSLAQSSTPVATFLRTASAQGYELGRTPLNAFLKKAAAASAPLPALSADDTKQLKTLHRLFQLTPSNDSLQAALKLGFTSAHDIASQTRSRFMAKYGSAFPSLSEADLVYRKAQQVDTVVFNFFAMAKVLDATPPVYALSSSPGAVQAAKNSIIEQFPTIQTLFGSMDFCQCEECQSVLSPAAYFVDLLEFLGSSTSKANASNIFPLDVLIGSTDGNVKGRRPDLAALPLTCENSNTALPYIDLVNEILEYYVCNNNALDGGLAYNTGATTTDDLTAEPQNILPGAYSILLKSNATFGFPLGLPFDLWLETVRGFYGYLKTPLAQVLDALRPVDLLELFPPSTAPASPPPYYRFSIFAEALGLSPSEYALFTNPNAIQNWFSLYSYPTAAIALNGGTFPAGSPNFTYSPLTSAKTLAQYLGLTYQEMTELVTTGFLNPKLAAISFQIRRFGIDIDQAFSYTGQPGFPVLSAADKTAFEATLAAITQQHKALNSTFDAKAWLQGALPPNYSKSVLVLHNPAGGCDFAATKLEYADLSPATDLDFLKLNLFVRLWKKTGWTMDETDCALQLFFAVGGGLPPTTAPGFGAAFSSAWQTALVYLPHVDTLASKWQPALGRVALLPLWTPLATTGNNPIYAQIFLTPAVLNCDPAFDDPFGQFPSSTSDPLSQHQSGIQGALGLSASDVAAILADAGNAVTMVAGVPSFCLTNLSLLYRYNLLATNLNLSVEDFIALKGLSVDMTSLNPAVSGINPFAPPAGNPLKLLKDDLLFTQTLQLVQQANVVAGSGFTVEDLRYLLLHEFDPAGKYAMDQNALLTLVQSVTSGLKQIQNSNALPSDLTGLSDDLIQQKLSSLFPAPFLASVAGLFANSTGFTVAQSTPVSQIDPAQFSNYPELSISYDPVQQVQTLSYKGALLDWKKNQLLLIDSTPLFTGLLNQLQQQVKPTFDSIVGNLLGVWASLVKYEATNSGTAAIILTGEPDPALEIGYDADNKIQWASYRGVLTTTQMTTLTAANASPDFANLLQGIQSQSLPAFNELLGLLLGCWANMQSYRAAQAGVPSTNQIDPSLLSNYPQIGLSYDPAQQIQTLTCQGVWTTELQTALETTLATLTPAPNPASVAVLTNLLQAVRAQALTFFQTQATNWATVTDGDLDNDSQPYTGLNSSRMLKVAKGELLKVFLPLLAQKLSRQLVIQTLSAALSSDLSLTSSLVTDASLLADPANPGHSLLMAFLSVGRPGVSATYYASPKKSGAPLGSGAAIATTTATTDATNPSPATVGSAHFEGYLQVSTDGPYRFFAELANVGATAQLQIYNPPSTSSVTNPVLNYPATKTGDETSQFVDLQGGVAYHFTLDFTSLGAGGAASLLIQGEILPKGPLSQIQLYPGGTVDRFCKAKILLSKALQLIQGTGLNQNEVAYLTANSQQFDDFKLSALPTQPSTDPPALAATKARTRFAQFLTLADYADLRKGPAGGSDGLMAVFQNVGQTFTEATNSGTSNQNQSTPWTILGNLTHRDPQVVRDVAVYLGLIQQNTIGGSSQLTAVGDFGNNRGIRRIWQALQVIHTLGLPVAAVINSTKIVSTSRLTAATDPGNVIAGNVRNAVKAPYAVEVWRPVAKSVFDPLRQKKRDALVAYIVRDLQLQNEEQLFEYFLIDPGMEPVVQTSRLRLALSSVQTFIQRCLLNLENGNSQNLELNVAPNAIDADWWTWMKRYRVWEVNRKIFLHPEIYLEPELRLDKTDLFQTLESALLQGNITSDLVEDAFFQYLQGLEVRARLDIVATYLDQTGPVLEPTDQLELHPDYTLHVVGRTHGQPHQYFYRTYANSLWTAWTQVTPAIDGDHLVVAIWRNRVNLFWVTFQPVSQPGTGTPTDTTTPLAKMTFDILAKNITAAPAQQQIRVQLNWSEYFQGKWSDRFSSDVNQYDPVTVPSGHTFDASKVYIHVSKGAPDTYGNDGPISIHLDFPWPVDYLLGSPNATFSFQVTSKNCYPDFGTKYQQLPPQNPYTARTVDATQYTGKEYLAVEFLTPNEDRGMMREVILENVNDYAIVLCSNPLSPPFFANDPSLQEAGALTGPFFFKDINLSGSAYGPTPDELTFFVQPAVVASAVHRYSAWAVAPPTANPELNNSQWWQNIPIAAQTSAKQIAPIAPVPPVPGEAIYKVKNPSDWVTAPSTTVGYGSTIIGMGGRIAATQFKRAGTVSSAAAGVLGLVSRVTGNLNFVSSQGLTAAALRNIQLS